MSVARGLGKGISALLEDDFVQASADNDRTSGSPVGEVAISSIKAGRFQPRRHFEQSGLDELAESIRQKGIMQPLVLRPLAAGGYEIVAGERRFRASQMAGLSFVPAIVRELSDQEALEIALIENVQRRDLSALEEGEGYARLMDEFGYTQEELAKSLGKSRSHIANLLRLLNLPDEVRLLLEQDKISMGHARALLASQSPHEHANEVVSRGLSVRQTEMLVQGKLDVAAAPKPKLRAAGTYVPAATEARKDEDIIALEEALSQNIGLKVEIFDRGQKGTVVISYDSLAHLDDILRRLGGVA